MKKKLFFALLILGSLSIMGCGMSDYEKNLRSGYEKYQNGGKMSQDEYNAVNDFKNWQNSNSQKTYNEWNH